MRDRIPFLFAAVLVAALIGVVGVAAFSISNTAEAEPEVVYDGAVSGRVAAAVLAVSVSTAAAEPIPAVSLQGSAQAEPAESETTAATSPATGTTADTTPPALVITFPEDRATVTKHVVQFTGTSEPGAQVTSGPFEAATALNGDWTISLVVEEGYNSTVFTATDEAGNETSARIVVFYEPPPPPTTTTHTHAPAETTTTHTHAPTTTTPPTTQPPSDPDCPVSGSCSPSWPADSHGARGGEAWRPLVEQYWPAERVDCVVDLIQRESSGNPQANNSGRYLGLLQHSVWAWNGRASAIGLVDGNGLTAHPYNGAANIAAGAWLANNSDPWWKPWPPTKTIPSCQALGAG